MKLQFGNLAEEQYEKWKQLSDQRYLSLKSTILDALQHPTQGTGQPHTIEFSEQEYWCRNFGQSLFVIYSTSEDTLKIEAISSIPDSDIIEKSTDEQHSQVINLMKKFMDNGKPKLGIFWYDYKSNRLFGVEKGDADMYISQGRLATYPKLHKTYWQKMHHKAIARGDTDSIFYKEHNYTLIPRGRIFLENGFFYVNVGNWINGDIGGEHCVDKNALRALLLDEFNLPDNFRFRQDVHWDIGHGWSEEQF